MLEGKVAVITGAGGGVGRGIALRLAEEKVKIVVNDLDSASAEETERLVKGLGVEAITVIADVSDKQAVKGMMERVEAEFGRLDILVNNAGKFDGAPLEEMTEEQWDAVLNVDLKGSFLCAQAAALYMRKGKYGRVINVSSPDAFIGDFSMVNYIAAKAGIFGLTACVAKEFSRYVKEEGCSMTCNTLLVGYTPTAMTESSFPVAARERFGKILPLGVPMDPERDAGAVVAHLASEKADYITGAKIPATGGLYACIAAY